MRIIPEKLKERAISWWRFIVKQSKAITLPYFDGLTLYDVASFFFKGIIEGAVTTRASSIAFSFFLALFPAIIFLFTLIPYIPIHGFQAEIFDLMKEILPPNSYEATKSTIDDILTNKRGGLLSVTFITTMLLATNGTVSILSNFSHTYHKIELRNFYQQYIAAFGLTLTLTLLLIVGVVAILFSSSVSEWIIAKEILPESVTHFLQYSRGVIVVLIVLLGISILFYYGPTKKKQWRFFSPGAILATTLVIISSVAFSYYVDNFSQYNKLYGSIGTLIIIQLWIYINSIGLIIGFELNASVAGARDRRNRNLSTPTNQDEITI